MQVQILGVLGPIAFTLPGLGRVIPKEGSSESEPLNQ